MRLDDDILKWVHTRRISGRIICPAQVTGANTKESTEQVLRKYYLSIRNSSTESQSNSWTASSRYHSLEEKIIRTIIKSDQTARKSLSTIAILKRNREADRDPHITHCRKKILVHIGTLFLTEWHTEKPKSCWVEKKKQKKGLNHISLI